MRRDSFKLLLLAGLLGFAVLYGMELSSQGIRNVNGPLETESAADRIDEGGDWTLPVGADRSGREESRPEPTAPIWADGEEEPGVAIPRLDREPVVDRFSGRTAEVLHELSRNGIRMVVSIFNRIAG
ncbi:hypothetical protein [Cohnella hongkongensis]|uniref:Uncharacterized protein n=1 Tax=Cohnella hongkongensis TaxID=178337 RepID=A0ABV9FE44_9BACL